MKLPDYAKAIGISYTTAWLGVEGKQTATSGTADGKRSDYS
ncbi:MULTISPECIES: hypothetical protein [unclassified Microcoleus]